MSGGLGPRSRGGAAHAGRRAPSGGEAWFRFAGGGGGGLVGRGNLAPPTRWGRCGPRSSGRGNAVLTLGLGAAGGTTGLPELKLGPSATTIPTAGLNVETVTYRNVRFNAWEAGGQAQAGGSQGPGLIFAADLPTATASPRPARSCIACR